MGINVPIINRIKPQSINCLVRVSFAFKYGVGGRTGESKKVQIFLIKKHIALFPLFNNTADDLLYWHIYSKEKIN